MARAAGLRCNRGVTDIDELCPCGRAVAFAECCEPIVHGERAAPTAEALMRSRYTAFALGEVDHLSRSWHPTTRPKRIHLGDDGGRRWDRLEVVATTGGGLLDQEGTVEFRAHHRDVDGGHGTLHEVSRFVRHDGTWTYLDGTHG